MNDQLQTSLAEIISRATQGIDASTRFLSAQLPDVIQQLLIWKMTLSALWFIGSIVVVIVITQLVRHVWNDRGTWDGEENPPASCVAGCLCLLYVIPALMFDITWIQIWLAPKVYLIEYAAAFAK